MLGEEIVPLTWTLVLMAGLLRCSEVEDNLGRAEHPLGQEWEREGRPQKVGYRQKCPDPEDQYLPRVRQVRLGALAFRRRCVPHHDCWPSCLPDGMRCVGEQRLDMWWRGSGADYRRLQKRMMNRVELSEVSHHVKTQCQRI